MNSSQPFTFHLFRRPVRAGRRPFAFSTTELVVTISLTACLIAISAVAIAKASRSRSQAVCAANLHAIGVAFSGYANDYSDYFPVPTPTAQWEDLLRPFVSRKSFQCPADTELFAALGSSYNWRDTGEPQTTLAGKTHSQVGRNDVALAYDMLPGWHEPKQIQVLFVDGQSVRLISQDSYFADLQRPPEHP